MWLQIHAMVFLLFVRGNITTFHTKTPSVSRELWICVTTKTVNLWHPPDRITTHSSQGFAWTHQTTLMLQTPYHLLLLYSYETTLVSKLRKTRVTYTTQLLTIIIWQNEKKTMLHKLCLSHGRVCVVLFLFQLHLCYRRLQKHMVYDRIHELCLVVFGTNYSITGYNANVRNKIKNHVEYVGGIERVIFKQTTN